MSSHGSPSLDLDARSRRTESRIAGASLLVAVACPWLIAMEPLQQCVLALASGCVVALAFWRSGWIGTRYRIARVAWLADGRWLLTDHGGRQFEAELAPESRRAAAFAWLRWQAPHRESKSMLLARGDLAAADLRRLLVRLGIDGLRNPLEIAFADSSGGFRTEKHAQRALASVATWLGIGVKARIPRTLPSLPVAPTRRS